MGTVLILIVLGIAIGIFVRWNKNEQARQAREQHERERAEEQRVEDCGRVVLDFANICGYIARKVISREELGELIDAGATPLALATEILNRIDALDGLVVGYQSLIPGQVEIEVKLTEDLREKHVYVIGKSGSGKTTLLRSMILQDIDRGNGVGVLAPEQEMLTEELLPYIPEHRIDDVVYLNPTDTDSPVCFNPLHRDEGEDVDLKVDENLAIFQRVFNDTGPRTESILRHGFYALIEREGSTLLDFPKLLDRGDDGFRKEIIRTSNEPATVEFWEGTYEHMPKDAHLPIETRLGRILRPRMVRSILCNPNPERNLHFRDAMDSGKILLFNLSDALLGEINSQLLGQLVVSKFQLATMSRADIHKASRRPFYLYIDEFQTFTTAATTSYEKMLSRARKYKLGLILAHQQTGQIPLDLLKEIFGNVSTIIGFQVSQSDASKLAKELITEIDGEVIHIPEESLLKLRVGQAYCKIAQSSFRMYTAKPPARGSSSRSRTIIERSRQNYGSPTTDESKEQRKAGETKTPPQGDILDDIDPSKVF